MISSFIDQWSLTDLCACTFVGKFKAPALTLKYQHPDKENINFLISIDLSPAIILDASFEELGLKWPRNPRSDTSWPSKQRIDEVKKKGIMLVAKQNFYWRISFAECEKELSHHADEDGGCRKMVHRIVKSFHREYWCKEANPALSSYMVKVRCDQYSVVFAVLYRMEPHAPFE